MAKKYRDEVLYHVIDALVSANTFLINASQDLETGYKNLNGQIKSSAKKISVKDLQEEIESSKTFIESMGGLVTNIENTDVESDTPLNIDATLNLDTIPGNANSNPANEPYDFSQELELMSQHEKEQYKQVFEELDLTEEEMVEVLKYIETGDTYMIALFYYKYQNRKDIKDKESERDSKKEELDKLESERNTLNDDKNNVFAFYDAYMSSGMAYTDNIEQTFNINGEDVTFHNYNEAIEYFEENDDEGRAQEIASRIESLSSEVSALNSEIKQCRVNLQQENDEIEFTKLYGEYFNNPDLIATKFIEEISKFASDNGVDLKTCSLSEVFRVAGWYSKQNQDKGFNWLLVIDYLRENNTNFKNKTDQEIIDMFKTEYLMWGSLPLFQGTDTLYDLNRLLTLDYKYMSDEDKRVFNYLYEIKGRDEAFKLMKTLETRSYNAMLGTELGYEKFETIVSQPGKIAECITAYITGGIEGVRSWYENTYSLVTGDYSLTVNDYEMQTIQYLLQTCVASYAEVTKEDLISLEEKGQITSEEHQEILNLMNSTNTPVRYYDILAIKGEITTEQAGEIAHYMSQIAGGENYARYVLTNFYSGGVSSGNMLPSMLISTIPGMQWAGELAMFASCAGGTYREQMRSGAYFEQALLAGIVNGGMELATEKMLGGLTGLSDNVPDLEQWATLSLKERAVALMITSPLSEMKEETFQLFVGDFIQCLITGEPYTLTDQIAQIPDTLISTYISTVGSNSATYGRDLVLNVGGEVVSFAQSEIAKLVNPDGSIDSQTFLNMIEERRQLSSSEVQTTESIEEVSAPEVIPESQTNVEDIETKTDEGKVEVQETENQETATQPDEAIIQEEQDRKLEESIESISAPEVEQTETEVQNLETQVNEDNLETPNISENIEAPTNLEVSLNAENINQIMNNPNNMYYGHGTSDSDGSIAVSIMENGLRCSHGQMYFTTNALETGTHMNENTLHSLNNWSHNDSKNVVIVSLPIQYMFLSGNIAQREEAFYYRPTDASNQNLTTANYVMPEFILGYYDSTTGVFHRNPNYYELLTPDSQQRVLDRVKENLVSAIEEYSDIETYRETCRDLGYDFPLTDEEVARYSQNLKNNKDNQTQPETLEVDTNSESESTPQEVTDWDNYFEDEDWGVDALETKTDEGKVDVGQIEEEVQTTTETVEEVASQEEQARELEENIESLTTPNVEQTETGVQNLEMNAASLNNDILNNGMNFSHDRHRGFDESTTYGAYKQENIFKTDIENINDIIEQIRSINTSDQVLIELTDTRGLTLEILDSIPDNVDIRIIGSYTEEYFKSLKSGNQNLREKATYSKSELRDILTRIESIEMGIDPSWNQYEVALYIYEYLRKNMVYTIPEKVNDGGGMSGRSRNFDSLIGLVNQISTCNGFALIYQELLTRQGIECVNVGGKYLKGREGQHAWNIVTIDGNSFIVDSIWDCQDYENGIDHTTGFGTVNPDMYSPRSYQDLFYSTINLNQEDVDNMLDHVSSSVPTTINSYEEIIERFKLGLEEGRRRIDELVNGKPNDVENLETNTLENETEINQTEEQESVTESSEEVVSQKEQTEETKKYVEELKNIIAENNFQIRESDFDILINLISTYDNNNFQEKIALIKSLKDNISKLIGIGLINDSYDFSTNQEAVNLFCDIVNSSSANEIFSALKYIKNYEVMKSMFSLLNPEMQCKAFEIVNASIDEQYRIITSLSNNQILENLKYVTDSLLQVDIIKELNGETKEETEKLKITALANLKKDDMRAEVIKSLSLEAKIDQTIKLKNSRVQLELLESMTDTEKMLLAIKCKDNKDLQLNALIRIEDVNSLDREFFKSLSNSERELFLSIVTDTISENFASYINKIKYSRIFPKNIKNMILSTLNSKRLFFQNFSNLTDTFYGADQDATRKFILFEFSNTDFFNSEEHIKALKDYLTKNFLNEELSQELKNRNTIYVNEFLNNIETKNFKPLTILEYEIIKDFFKEYASSNNISLSNLLLKTFKRVEGNEYIRLRNKLSELGITNPQEARKILDCLNTTGICSYADVANIFFDYFSNNSSEFQKAFGYDMTVNIDGISRLNSSELLLDMYMYFNSNLYKKNDYFFELDSNGKWKLANKYANSSIDTSKQAYLSYTNKSGIDENAINQFLKYKNASLKFEKDTYYYLNNITDKEEIISKIALALGNGDLVSLGIIKNLKPFNFINKDGEIYQNTTVWNEGGGHAVYLTGIDSNFVYVASWGIETRIPLDDFLKNTFTINISSITEGVDDLNIRNQNIPIDANASNQTALADIIKKLNEKISQLEKDDDNQDLGGIDTSDKSNLSEVSTKINNLLASFNLKVSNDDMIVLQQIAIAEDFEKRDLIYKLSSKELQFIALNFYKNSYSVARMLNNEDIETIEKALNYITNEELKKSIIKYGIENPYIKLKYIQYLDGEYQISDAIKKLQTDQEKIDSLHYLNSEFYISEVLCSLDSDELKLKNIPSKMSEYYIVDILSSLKNVKTKIDNLSLLKNNNYKANVIASIEDVNLKLQYMEEILKSENSKAIVISSLPTNELKLANLNYLKNDLNKATVISSLDSDDAKINNLSILKDDVSKAKVLTTLADDDTKIANLRRLKDENAITNLLSTLDNDALKIENMYLLTDEENRFLLIRSIGRDFRLKLYKELKSNEYKIKGLNWLSKPEEKVELVLNIDKSLDQIMAVAKLSEEEKKLFVQKTEKNDYVKAYALTNINDNNFKISMMSSLSLEDKVIVISSIQDASIREKLYNELNLSEEQVDLILSQTSENGTIRYSINFFDKLKEMLLSKTNGIRQYFKEFCKDLSDTFYGADQDATRKFVSFEFTNKEYLLSNLDKFKEYFKKRTSYSDLKIDKIVNNILSSDSISYNIYERIRNFISENENKDPIKIKDIIERIFSNPPSISEEYLRLQRKLQDLGVTDLQDARKILDCLNTTGICSYASIANLIFASYKNNPEGFEKDFGYSMYVTIDGKRRLNSSELLLDMYLYCNSNLVSDQGTEFFEIDENNNIKVSSKFDNSKIDTVGQTYLITGAGIADDIITSFLHSKKSNLRITSTNYRYGIGQYSNHCENVETLIEICSNALENGNLVSLGIFKEKDKQIRFIPTSDTNTEIINTSEWDEGDAHAIFLTGIDRENVYVASWGMEYKIPLIDFLNNSFSIDVAKINGIT